MSELPILPHVLAADLALYAYRTRVSQTESAWRSWLSESLQRRGFRVAFLLNVDDHEGFIASNESACVVVFRGSDRMPDWVNNAYPKQVRYTDGMPGEALHGGYHLAVQSMIDRDASAAIRMHYDTMGPIHFVGHSKGGALAAIAALRAWDAGLKVASLTTFGAPRCMNRAASNRLSFLMGNRYSRFVNQWDPVPQAWWTTGLTHGGFERYIDREGDIRSRPGFWWKMWDRWQAWRDGDKSVALVHSMRTYHLAVTAWSHKR